MIILRNHATWHRPYYISTNNKCYVVDRIYIYNKDGIVCSEHCCFRDKNGEDIEQITLDIDEVLSRRKEKFDGKVFVINIKNRYSTIKECDLYIPMDILNIHHTKYKKMYNNGWIVEEFDGEQNIHINKFHTNIESTKNAILFACEELSKQITMYYISNKTEETIDKAHQLLDLLNDYALEKQRIADASIEELLEEFGQKENKEE